MLLGTLLANLESDADAAAALEAMGDLVLFAEVQALADRYEETAGEYLAGAVRRFARAAGDEEWTGLIGALERDADPARAAVERMLRWAMARDEADGGDGCGSGCGCAAQAPGGGHGPA